MLRKFWRITGTDITGEDKVALKVTRRELNISANTPEVTVLEDKTKTPTDPTKWAHRITKGAQHPHVAPYFREIRIGQMLLSVGKVYQKTGIGTANEIGNDGLIKTTNVKFLDDVQVGGLL